MRQRGVNLIHLGADWIQSCLGSLIQTISQDIDDWAVAVNCSVIGQLQSETRLSIGPLGPLHQEFNQSDLFLNVHWFGQAANKIILYMYIILSLSL